MAEGLGVVALSNKHEMIMNWMLVNPDKSLRECADTFGISQSWLSTLIHSDIFQAQLAARHEGIRARIADTIPQKMRVAADIGIQKLAEKLEESEDPDFILDATDKLLHRMGYAPARVGAPAPQSGSGNVQNNFYVSAGDLAQARETMARLGEATAASSAGAPEAVIEGEIIPQEPIGG